MKRTHNRCCYCGIYSTRLEVTQSAVYCKAEIPCFNRILAQLRAERERARIGAQASNVLFNLSQQQGKSLGVDTCATMADIRKKWDAESLKCAALRGDRK